MATRYRASKVAVSLSDSKAATWSFSRKPVRGTEFVFRVIDDNYPSRNEWEFVVRVPQSRNERIEVRPIRVPNLKAWADLDRRALTFGRATMPGYTSWVYAPVAIAAPRGEGTKRLLHEKRQLPPWFRPYLRSVRRKKTVRRTRGTDGEGLVVLARPDDYTRMIRIYLALKAWVRSRGLVLA